VIRAGRAPAFAGLPSGRSPSCIAAALPETGDWSATLGALDKRSADEALAAWKASVVAAWRNGGSTERQALVPLDEASMAEAKRFLEAAER
jgi:hypothetical protein